jgi:hypothetical protein
MSDAMIVRIAAPEQARHLPDLRRCAWLTPSVPRIPLLAGSRVLVVNTEPDDLVLRPPPPGEAIPHVGAAVRDALRFPLAGEPLEALVPRRGRATIVVELPALPLPGSTHDPRKEAIAAAVGELERAGIQSGYQTILVAGGLQRRAGPRELGTLVSPEFARRFHGRVVVHDAEDPALVPVAAEGARYRVNPALLEADVVVVVTAAESVLHGGPAALAGCCAPETLRQMTAPSLLETSGSGGWARALALERLLMRRVAMIGASISLHHPRLTGALRGYPYDAGAVARVTRSPLRRGFRLLPASARGAVLHSLGLELGAAAAFAGPPSVAHAEALLRGIEQRAAQLDEPLDVLCLGVPRTTPYLPRERPNPLLVSYLALALALRLWRERFPVASGGTVILANGFTREYAHPTQTPYRAFFAAAGRGGPDELLAAEHSAAADERAVEDYRAGRTCHPLLPFLDWDSCRPALERLGAVVVAGCRDATAARQLGFVPTGSLGAALHMAHGRADGEPRVGYLLSPPYFPLEVGSGSP